MAAYGWLLHDLVSLLILGHVYLFIYLFLLLGLEDIIVWIVCVYFPYLIFVVKVT